jgi:hypothetical protein
MKTVILAWGTLWGQAKGNYVSLCYRGKSLKEYQCHASEVPSVKQAALVWAVNQGFTHYQGAGDHHKFPLTPPKLETSEEAVKRLAKDACFYVGGDDIWLRMQYCLGEDFTCSNENTGEDYTIAYADVDISVCRFYKLTLMER